MKCPRSLEAVSMSRTFHSLLAVAKNRVCAIIAIPILFRDTQLPTAMICAERCIYLADVGDNNARKNAPTGTVGKSVRYLYRIIEPRVTRSSNDAQVSATRMPFRYPSTPTKFADF